MTDQVSKLRLLGVPAAQISSVATKDERKHAVEEIEKLKLLYVTPELVATEVSEKSLFLSCSR